MIILLWDLYTPSTHSLFLKTPQRAFSHSPLHLQIPGFFFLHNHTGMQHTNTCANNLLAQYMAKSLWTPGHDTTMSIFYYQCVYTLAIILFQAGRNGV